MVWRYGLPVLIYTSRYLWQTLWRKRGGFRGYLSASIDAVAIYETLASWPESSGIVNKVLIRWPQDSVVVNVVVPHRSEDASRILKPFSRRSKGSSSVYIVLAGWLYLCWQYKPAGQDGMGDSISVTWVEKFTASWFFQVGKWCRYYYVIYPTRPSWVTT